MLLPSKVTKQDLDIICAYLANRREGATVSETAGAFETTDSNGQKRNAITQLGFIGKVPNGMSKVTERGRNVAAGDEQRTRSYLAAIRSIPAYMAVIEHASREDQLTITSAEVLSFWHERHPSGLSKTPGIRNNQAICLFHLMDGASLGRIIGYAQGRKKQFAFDAGKLRRFLNESDSRRVPDKDKTTNEACVGKAEDRRSPVTPETIATPKDTASQEVKVEAPQRNTPGAKRIFISHGGNEQIIDQVRQLASFGKLTAVAAQSRESPEKTMDAMRSCQAAVIHAYAGKPLRDADGKEVRLVTENALIALGAAMGCSLVAISSFSLRMGWNLGRSAGCARVPIQWRGVGWSVDNDADQSVQCS